MIECFVGENADLFAIGRTLAGLYALPGESVRIRRANWTMLPVSIALRVDGLKIAIELWDHCDRWDASLLEWCDVYAKRNMRRCHPSLFPHKIIPFGLNCACHSTHSALATLAALAGTLPWTSKARLKELYRYLVTPVWERFEHSPLEPVDDTILFQTRLWEPDETPGDRCVNQERVSLLLALKRAFGARMRGGIVPTPLARNTYPELLANQPCRQPEYIRWAKKPLIGIYSRGLFGSIGFKMMEYLAASKCIVSDPLENELPYPLEHLSTYRSHDECVAACDRLLTCNSLARFKRERSWAYYKAYVSPRSHMADVLARAKAAATYSK